MKYSSASALLLSALIGFVSCDDESSVDPPAVRESSESPSNASTPVARQCCSSLGAPASIVWGHELALASFGIFDGVAVDSHDGVLVADRSASSAADLGLSRLATSDGDTIYARPFGTVVATDHAGNAYIAGTFTTTILLGHLELQPKVAVDVFVAKLTPGGSIVFARGLGVNGDGLQSIAIDNHGWIAISGAPMGTVVLSPFGVLHHQFAFGGQVAFDSTTHLIVAGTVKTIDLGKGPITSTGQQDAFIAKVDVKGKVSWSELITSSDSFNVLAGVAIAVDHWGNIVLVGDFDQSIDLFGDTFDAIYAGESGRVQGAFVAKLNRQGDVIWKQGAFPAVDTSAVAIDLHGDILVSGDVRGNVPPFQIPMLTKIDSSGDLVWTLESTLTSEYGEGNGVAVDSCGSAYWAVTARDTASVLSPIHAWLLKVAP